MGSTKLESTKGREHRAFNTSPFEDVLQVLHAFEGRARETPAIWAPGPPEQEKPPAMLHPHFDGGIAKINGDWLGGEPIRNWLVDGTDWKSDWRAGLDRTRAPLVKDV